MYDRGERNVGPRKGLFTLCVILTAAETHKFASLPGPFLMVTEAERRVMSSISRVLRLELCDHTLNLMVKEVNGIGWKVRSNVDTS